MSGPIQDVIEEDAADLQFPKGLLTFRKTLAVSIQWFYLIKHVVLLLFFLI